MSALSAFKTPRTSERKMSGAFNKRATASATSSALMFQSRPSSSMPTEDITGVSPASISARSRCAAVSVPGAAFATRPSLASCGRTTERLRSVATRPRGESPAFTASPRSIREQVPASAPAISGISSAGLTLRPSMRLTSRFKSVMRRSTSTPPPCTRIKGRQAF